MYGTGPQAEAQVSAARLAGLATEDSICYEVKKDGSKWCAEHKLLVTGHVS